MVAAALEELAARDRELLQELLTTFGAAYAEAKERESALDFEDLQLRARDLLRDDPAIRERERQRFRSVMVDEFQDTNRLQTELLDLLCAGADGDLFVVGDEFQSIYGFRHADVAVFRERRARGADGAAADAKPPLAARGARRRERALRRRSSATSSSGSSPRTTPPRPRSGTPFELLVTDKAAYGGGRSPLAPLRGAARRATRARARRRR